MDVDNVIECVLRGPIVLGPLFPYLVRLWYLNPVVRVPLLPYISSFPVLTPALVEISDEDPLNLRDKTNFYLSPSLFPVLANNSRTTKTGTRQK